MTFIAQDDHLTAGAWAEHFRGDWIVNAWLNDQANSFDILFDARNVGWQNEISMRTNIEQSAYFRRNQARDLMQLTVLTGSLFPFMLALWLNSKYFHARRKDWLQMCDQDQPWKVNELQC